VLFLEINILETLVLDKLNPTLQKRKTSNKTFEEWLSTAIAVKENFQAKLREEISSLEDQKQIKLHLRKCHSKLVNIADKLFGYIYAQDKTFDYQISFATNLISVQKSIHVIVEEIIDHLITKYSNDFNQDQPIPEKERFLITRKLHENHMQLKKHLRNTNSKLIEITFDPFSEILDEKKQLTYRKSSYLLRLTEDLLVIAQSGTNDKSNAIMFKLVQSNFNSWRFFNYVTDRIKNKVDEEKEISGKLLKYHYYLKRINQGYIQTDIILYPEKTSLNEFLSTWLCEEISYLEKDNQLRNGKNTSPEMNIEIINKVILNLSVSQFACFIKLCHDLNVITNKNLTELFNTLSAGIQTKRTENASPGNLSKYYYMLEESSLKVVKNLLIQMLNGINDRLH
jgi:hypothetical protein